MKEKDVLKAIMHEIRCPICNSLLLKAKFWGDYSIQTVCHRCKNMVEITKIKRTVEKTNNVCDNIDIKKEEL